MNRIQNIFQNSPNLVRQTQRHRRCFVQQRIMHPCPVVQIPPQPYRILQHFFQVRAGASTPYQASLLSSYRTVEPFHMRGVDLAADTQFLNTPFDFLLFAKQRFGRYLQQMASAVSNFLHNADLQIRRRFERGVLEPASAIFATTMFDLSKYRKNGPWIWQMIVYQNQRRVFVFGTDSHRSGQLYSIVKSTGADNRIEQKPALYGQSRMEPCFALFLLRRLRSFFGTLTNSVLSLRLTVPSTALGTSLPCSSSICTASRGLSISVEIKGAFTCFLQQTLDGAGINFADVRCCFNRTAMGETFDNAYNSSLR